MNKQSPESQFPRIRISVETLMSMFKLYSVLVEYYMMACLEVNVKFMLTVKKILLKVIELAYRSPFFRGTCFCHFVYLIFRTEKV